MSDNKLSSKDIKKIGDAVDALPSGTMNGIFNASKKEIDPVGLAINAFSEALKSSQPSPKPPTVTISRESAEDIERFMRSEGIPKRHLSDFFDSYRELKTAMEASDED